jgi:membrane protease YdiL (CAAX protease family)
MSRLFLIGLASWCWVFVRAVPGLGYEFTLSFKVLKAAGLNFLYFAVLALPAGVALHFIAWNPRWRGLPQFSLDFLTIFLFIALLEELFFRGMLQVLISNTLRSRFAGQALVACLFGLFHILHAPFPNWPYVALAAVAGWFYGSAFRNGGGLMASALTHAAVDTVWRTFFARG